MSKLYHITVRTGYTGGYPAPQFDILASNTAVAIKRALDTKRLRSAKSVRVECNLSDHGEYDKARFLMFDAAGSTKAPIDAQGTYRNPMTHVRRSEAAERLGIEAQRILDQCPEVAQVKATSRDVVVCVNKAGTNVTAADDLRSGQRGES